MKISTDGQSRSHSLKDLLLSSVCASVLALSCVPEIARADENVVNAIGTTINVTGGDISTTGDGDPTVTADHQGTVTLSDVTITTQGHSSHGLYANDGSTISITDSAITTEGYNGRGVYAIGGSSITLTDTNIWTFGGAAAGIFAVGSGTNVDATNVNISTTGSSGNGVFAFEDAVVTIDGGKLDVAGDGVPLNFIDVVGLRASFGGQISAEDLEINMAGQNVIGLSASGVSGSLVSPSVTLTGSSGTFTGMNSTGGKVADGGSITLTGSSGTFTGMNSTGGKVADGGSITLDHSKLTVENGVGFVMIDDASATLINSTVTSSARTFDTTFFESGMSQQIIVDGESRIINTEDLTLLQVGRLNDGSDGEVKLTIRGGSSVEGSVFDEDYRDGNGNTTVVIENASLTGMMKGVQNLELSKGGAWNATFDSTVDQISLGEGGGKIGATGFDVTLAAPISGPGGLTTTGDKILTLTGNSTFEGGLTIESGTVRFGNGGTSGAYGGNIVNNATLVIDRSNGIIYNGEISGSGNAIKKGLGTLTLTGENSSDGVLTIERGTVRVGDGGTTGSIAGDVINNSSLVFDRSNAVNFAGDISGDGKVINQGDGNVTLGGANTYKGGTTIKTGALTGTVKSFGSGDIADDGLLVINQATDASFSNVISGDGKVTKEGAGNVTLADANTYKGGTTIKTGALTGTVKSFGEGNIADDGTLVINQATDASFSNVISGDGKVTKEGAGNVTLADANTYKGGTTIKTGALTGTVKSFGEGNIANGGTLVINQATDAVFSNVVSGDGKVTKEGAGNVTLADANTYKGGTTIKTGALTGTVKSFGEGNIANDGGLVIDQDDDARFSNAITGSGKLTKDGAGNVTLADANTYSGGTTIKTGALTGTVASFGEGNIANGGTLVINQATDAVFSNVVSGDGNVTKEGAGNVTLAEANTYKGGTTIKTGALTGTVKSFGEGKIANDGTLVINQTTDASFSNIISGDGKVTKEGAGDVTLADANTYKGGTTIKTGALTGTVKSFGEGNIANDATLVINQATDASFSNVISGDGKVTKEGAGNLTLTGDNTYTGGTTVSAGMLRIGNGGTTGSIVGNVVDNASLIFDRSDTLTFGGVISGAGDLKQAGTGTLTLTGENTFIGGTTVAAGTLRIGNGGESGWIVGNVLDNASLVFDRSDERTFGGVISGDGKVTKEGGGTLTLTGENIYAGDTTVSAGTLRIGNGGTTGSIVGNVIDNADLVFDRSADLAFAGDIFGSGRLGVNGGMTLTLTGDTSILGDTTVLGSTLKIGNGGTTGSISGNIATDDPDYTGSAGHVVFDRSNAITYGGAISGAGDLKQASIGTLTLTGEHTYTGGTTVSAGTLRIGEGGVSGWIVGNVFDNASLIFDRSDERTFGGVISGDGQVTQQGIGTLTLTGENTYTGGTTVSAGTLRIGNGGTTGSIVGDVVDNADLVFDRSDDLAFAGDISGSGRFAVNGGMTLTLTGDNTVTGGTTVLGSTLKIGNGGATGSISGNIATDDPDYTGSAGHVVFDRSDAITYDGVISGAGDLKQAGTGTLIVTGENTFTGGTTVAAGTLRIGDGGTSGSIVGNVVDNASLVFDRSDARTFSGVISGDGQVTKQGIGTLTLTGENTFTGGTTVAAGTLRIGNGGESGWILGNVLDNASLVFDRSDARTFGGVISGNGQMTKQGDGTLTLTADNTYAGGSTVSAGTLRIGNGGTTGSIVGNVLDNASLVFDRSDEQTFRGVISGNGQMTQQGIGTLTLTGENTYTGGTTVSAGTLRIGNGGTTGSIVGDVIDNADLVFDRSADLAFAGDISGSGRFAVNGGMTLTLTGDNTVTGGTTVLGSTLKIGNGGTIGSISGNIATDDPDYPGLTGHVVFDRSNEITYGGVISGAGDLKQAGTGTLTLTGENTFTGGTRVAAGTLRIGDGGTSGSIVGNVVDNASLVFDRSDARTFSGVISGNGQMTKQGDGTLTLTADNTYTGGTTVSAGTLHIGNGGTNGWIVGNVLDNASLVFDRSDERTFGGVISGDGKVTKEGDGTLTFTGENTYAGGTTVSAGTLRIGNGGTTGSIVGDVVDNADLVFDRSADLAFAGDISGSGRFAVNGGMTLTLTGDNTVIGGTMVLGSTLKIGNGGTIGSISGNIATDDPDYTGSAGHVVFDRSNEITYGGAISGAGDLKQAGTGTLIVTGENTFTGGTTVAAGTLRIGNGGESGWIIGNVVDNASLVFDRFDDRTFGGVISGAGHVRKTGSGTLTLTGLNTYAGGTMIDAGTLIGSVTSFGSGRITDNAALIINQTTDATFANVIDGDGSLTKTGSGTLELTGNSSSFTGSTDLSQGGLKVNGSLAGSIVTVRNGTVLSGSGTVGGVVALSGSTIAPGNSPGTLTVVGNYSQAVGSTYQAELTPRTSISDKIAVGGTAEIVNGAILNVSKYGSNSPYALDAHYTVLTATGGVTGTYILTGNTWISTFYSMVADYDVSNVYVDAKQTRAFSSAGKSRNQVAVADGLQSLPTGNTLRDTIAMSQTDEEARSAFNQLTGEVHSSIKGAVVEDSQFIRSAAIDRLRSAFETVGASANSSAAYGVDGLSVWSNGYGSWRQTEGDGNAASMSHNLGGFVAGADAPVFDNWRLGVLAGYGHSNYNANERASSGSSDSYTVGAYGGTQLGNIGLRFGTAYSWNDISTSRNVGFADLTDRLSGKYDAGLFQAFGEAGYRMDLGSVAFEPFAGLAHVSLDSDGFTEKGGLAGLATNGGSTDVTFSTLGLRSATTFAVGEYSLTAAGSVAWRHAYGNTTPTTNFNFAGSDAFGIAGLPIATDAALIDLGLSTNLNPNVSLGISYTGQFANGSQSQGVRGNLNVKF
ncbi:autotransporter-associated beta strand repeat-containing protein [Agrobacterium sp. 22-210-1]